MKLKKKCIGLLLCSILSIGFVSQPVDSNAASQIKYFTQSEAVKGSNTPYGNNVKAGHYVQSGDAKIYYEVYGKEKGNPIFIFHGGAVGIPYEMGSIIDKLRKNHKVIVVSSRGHGRSEIGHTPISYKLKANDMKAVMDKESTSPATLLGFSDGAYTAYKIASMYPKQVDRVVAIGAGTLKAGYFPSEIKVSDLEKIDSAFIKQQMEIMPEPNRYQEFLNDYMAFWNTMEVGQNLLSTIEAPVLLVAGDEDDHAPMVTVVEAAQYIPNSRVAIIPKAGHTAFIDNADTTWNVIHSFVESEKKDLTGSKKVQYNLKQ